ncbi:DUF1871 family protein [Rummeliibacillus stabekisii]|uniref:DUF1871 domain-containing protein n=1 Tax=Rummeliibacillus stabekisii TaxID=241244 RepID=A0A143HD81_9BACL|nr:DUF1871 family protein [Rummeliibacillus stabekisii]AMW99698.1 hypothetical protein ATY39_09755 [Rummeliibacillus stabekisii]
MENIKMNRKAILTLEAWNPFNMKDFRYDTEAADVVAALQYIDDPSELGKKIQHIYEQSFEQWIPIEKCVEISYKLLAIKFEAKCIV